MNDTKEYYANNLDLGSGPWNYYIYLCWEQEPNKYILFHLAKDADTFLEQLNETLMLAGRTLGDSEPSKFAPRWIEVHRPDRVINYDLHSGDHSIVSRLTQA